MLWVWEGQTTPLLYLVCVCVYVSYYCVPNQTWGGGFYLKAVRWMRNVNHCCEDIENIHSELRSCHWDLSFNTLSPGDANLWVRSSLVQVWLGTKMTTGLVRINVQNFGLGNTFENVIWKEAAILFRSQGDNPSRASDAIWWQIWPGSTLVQVMACCLTAPSHNLNQCWQLVSEVQ